MDTRYILVDLIKKSPYLNEVYCKSKYYPLSSFVEALTDKIIKSTTKDTVKDYFKQERIDNFLRFISENL